MFLRTTAGSAAWNSQIVPRPPIFTGESSNRFRTSARSAAESVSSTPCWCVVLNSTASNPGLGEILEEGREVPILGDVVGDRAELQPAAGGLGKTAPSLSGRLLDRLGTKDRTNGGQRRRGRQAVEELSSLHGD